MASWSLILRWVLAKSVRRMGAASELRDVLHQFAVYGQALAAFRTPGGRSSGSVLAAKAAFNNATMSRRDMFVFVILSGFSGRKVSRNQSNLLIQYGYFRRESSASNLVMQN